MRCTAVTPMLALCLAPGLALACWEEAAQRYGVAPALLHAIARVESGLDPAAVNNSHRKSTGTHDIGLMQINSSHLQTLSKHGIREADLYDSCINIHVGAWLLADLFLRHGVSWEAVGAYNAACTQLRGRDCQVARTKYAWRVFRHLTAIQGTAIALPTAAHSQPAGIVRAPILAARIGP